MRAFTILLLSLVLTACYEPSEGCLDRSATNFSLDADEQCPDCCAYPNLKIRFSNKWQYPDSFYAFRTDTFYIDASGDPFRIERIRFYWSNFKIDLNDGSQLPTTDLITIKTLDGSDTTTLNVINHFALTDVSSSSDNLTLGTIHPNGVMVGFSTDFGLARPENGAIATEFPDDHVLGPQLGQMNYGPEKGYVFAKIELFRDTTAIDTVPLIINIFGDAALRSINLDLPFPVQLIEGFNPLLVIETDFAQWFDGVNIRAGDTTEIQTRIVENIAESFTLKEVLAN